MPASLHGDAEPSLPARTDFQNPSLQGRREQEGLVLTGPREGAHQLRVRGQYSRAFFRQVHSGHRRNIVNVIVVPSEQKTRRPPLSNGCSAAHAQVVPEQGSERRDRGRVAGSTARVPRACVLPAAFHTVLSPA